ncbi:MAG: hypothetical protein R3A44_11870 [Caldilineaceae bacterium]
MTHEPTRVRQVVDWGAAFWAGIVSGLVFLLLNLLLLPYIPGMTAPVFFRYVAAIVMGTSVLPPPADNFTVSILVAAVLVNFALAIVFAFLLAIITHQWGLVVGILVGALFGFAVYLINLYAVMRLFPWFFLLQNSVFAITHVIFGAVAGAVYEMLEVEKFVSVNGEEMEGANV